MAVGATGSHAWAAEPVEKKGDMIYRTLGKTGEKVSAHRTGRISHRHAETEAESTRIIRTAIDRGITFMDNCWDYHDGDSEVRMGKALRGRLPRQGLPDDQDRRPHQSRPPPTRLMSRCKRFRPIIST